MEKTTSVGEVFEITQSKLYTKLKIGFRKTDGKFLRIRLAHRVVVRSDFVFVFIETNILLQKQRTSHRKCGTILFQPKCVSYYKKSIFK